MRMNALPPVSGGTESPLVTLGRDLLQNIANVYIAKRTGQVPPPGYMSVTQAQAATAAATPKMQARAPNVLMIAVAALGAVLVFRMFRRRRR